MHAMRIALAASIAVLAGSPAFAQSSSGLSGSSASSVGSGSGSATTITSPTAVSPQLGTTAGSATRVSPGSTSGAMGDGIASPNGVATEGSSTINSTNVDSIARSGNAGEATSFQGSSGVSTPMGSGASTSMDTTYPAVTAGVPKHESYSIPEPRIGVDLGAIRGALEAEPSATPKLNGN